MNPLAILKPEYLYRPRQLFKRIFKKIPTSFVAVNLPWGLPLQLRCDELIGRRIWATGIFELTVSEVVWRLTDESDLCIDAGANIGYMASIMAFKAGINGAVFAFEPHPEVFTALFENANSWGSYKIAKVKPLQMALSACHGIMQLEIPESFSQNRGLSRLSDLHVEGSVPVEVQTIDNIVKKHGFVGLMKIDVEGHEASVITGAVNSIRNKDIRDIVYEDYHSYPSLASELLLKNGYTIFKIEYSWFGPLLKDPERSVHSSRKDETPNYLATNQPERALSIMRAYGWKCLAHKTGSKKINNG